MVVRRSGHLPESKGTDTGKPKVDDRSSKNGQDGGVKEEGMVEELEKSLFEAMVESIVQGVFKLEQVVDMAYEFGVQHGETLRQEYSTSRKDSGISKKRSLSVPPPGEEQSSSQLSSPAASFSPPPTLPSEALSMLKRAKSSSDSLPSYLSAPVKEYIGVEPVSGATSITFRSFVSLLGRTVVLDEFSDAEEAAHAHDRALIRALGPKNCSDDRLNNPLQTYAKDPIDSFSQYDKRLRQAMFGMSWSGPREIDFSCLVLSAPSSQRK